MLLSTCKRGSHLKRFPLSRLQDLARFGMNLLVFELAGVPSAAQGFYQIYGADHLLAEQLRFQPLAGEQRGLRSDDVEVSGHSADVTIVGDGQSAARIIDRRTLRGQRLRERAQIADAVLDLLECGEHGLAVIGDGLVIRGARGGKIGAVSSAFDDGLQGVGTERPEKAGRIQKRRNVACSAIRQSRSA